MRMFSRFVAVLFILALLGACTPKSTSSGDSGSEPASQSYENLNFYYDFDDILIPKELDFQPDESHTLDNKKFRAGIMRFTGRVDIQDLIQFFINNMAKDNWERTATIKGKVSVLSFEKFNKSCVIKVDDTFAKATVTIIAVETKDGSSETSLGK
ncbi:hypothetical protein [Salidesulfovibrio onnuriiensis]|uniref:hypothetical protein n=1 Tax=Salidesulfovibrio onnuriiensis TaxID=2583823 RepID=UPI0011C7A7C3|nr:hypothetical protein [Salidesulfovibrio onnuriiensis]